MKPRKLFMRGFRSYREHPPIEFSPSGLSAMVGDTGAGKSSILQAMIYALYNSAAWDARGVHELIADSEDRLQVILEFEVSGKVYEVTRSTARKNLPPVHRLKCLSHTEDEITGETPVTRAIEGLLGMTRETFKAAVILPQDQFQELLHASPRSRTVMLKSIFRLDELDKMKQHAENGLAELQPLLNSVIRMRGQLLADPNAEESMAKEQRAVADGRLKVLKQCEADQKLAAKDAEQMRKQHAEGAAARDGLNFDGNVLTTLRAAATAAAQIASVRSELKDQLEQLHGELREHERHLQGAEGQGLGLNRLTALRPDVARLAQDLQEIDIEEQRLAKEHNAIGTVETAIEQAEKDVAALRQRIADSDRLVAELANDAQQATTAVAAAVHQLQIVRTATASLIQRRGRVEETHGAIGPLDHARAEALQAATDMRVKLDGLRREHEARQRQNMAAALGTHVHGGEPCPICERPLPKDYVPPDAPDLDASAAAVAAAAPELETAMKAVQTSTSAWESAQNAAAAAEAELEKAQHAHTDALDALKTLVHDLPATLPEEDSLILKSLRAREADLNKQLVEARQNVQNQREALNTAQATASEQKKELDRRTSELSRARDALKQRSEQAGATEKSIPAVIRGVGPIGERLVDILSVIDDQLAKLNRHATDAQKAHEQIAELGKAEVNLQQRDRAEVQSPHEQALHQLLQLHSQTANGTKLLGGTPAPARPEPFSLAADGEWATSLVACVGELRAQLESYVAQTERKQAASLQSAAAALLRAGVADVDGLSDEIVSRSTDIKDADRRIKVAQRHRELAKQYDPTIAEGQALEARLTELRRLLQDGQFPGYVVQQRQKALLRVASEQLAAMTVDRYAFSEDFQIVDQPTGQTRSPQTLSGGETFLASLSLALGLVELAGRSGGLVESLFLDEGFGALDANALDDAISALETHVASGRMVTIVSHLRSIAERIDPLLLVTKDAMGSHAQWVTGAERERLLDTELETGLVA